MTAVVVGGWRVGPAVVTDVTTLTPSGAANPGAWRAMSGSNGLTANGAGMIQLVSPMRIRARAPAIFQLPDRNWAAFATMELTFVPEPGTGLLFAVAAASLAAFARRRT